MDWINLDGPGKFFQDFLFFVKKIFRSKIRFILYRLFWFWFILARLFDLIEIYGLSYTGFFGFGLSYGGIFNLGLSYSRFWLNRKKTQVYLNRNLGMYAYILSYYERFTDGYFTWKKYRIFCLTEIILTKFRIFYERYFWN